MTELRSYSTSDKKRSKHLERLTRKRLAKKRLTKNEGSTLRVSPKKNRHSNLTRPSTVRPRDTVHSSKEVRSNGASHNWLALSIQKSLCNLRMLVDDSSTRKMSQPTWNAKQLGVSGFASTTGVHPARLPACIVECCITQSIASSLSMAWFLW